MSAEFSDDEIAFIRRAQDSDISRPTLASFEIAALTEANARALAALRAIERGDLGLLAMSSGVSVTTSTLTPWKPIPTSGPLRNLFL